MKYAFVLQKKENFLQHQGALNPHLQVFKTTWNFLAKSCFPKIPKPPALNKV